MIILKVKQNFFFFSETKREHDKQLFVQRAANQNRRSKIIRIIFFFKRSDKKIGKGGGVGIKLNEIVESTLHRRHWDEGTKAGYAKTTYYRSLSANKLTVFERIVYARIRNQLTNSAPDGQPFL